MALANDVRGAIDRAAGEVGVSPDILYRVAMIESGGNPHAKNPRSSAGGLFQQIDANARHYGVEDRFDPYQSALGAARFMADNAAFLRGKLGREPTAHELYLAHQQGAGGALRLLQNPDADVSGLLGGQAAALNGGKGMKARDFVAMWAGKMGGGMPFSPMGAGAGANGAMPTYGVDNLPANDGTVRRINLGGKAQLMPLASTGAGVPSGVGQTGDGQGGLMGMLASLGKMGGGEQGGDGQDLALPAGLPFGAGMQARRGSSILERLAGDKVSGTGNGRGLRQ